MGVIIKIGNAEAIPVRAIPFVTGKMMSAGMVAASLAHNDDVGRLEGISAYRYHSDGSHTPILPKEWDGIEADLKALSHRLKTDEKIDGESYSTWRRESIVILPPGVFVWKAEFEAAFIRAFSPVNQLLVDERPGDRELNFAPLIPTELIEKVEEGFPLLGDVPKTAEKPLATTERNTLLAIIAGLCDYSDVKHQERGAASQIARMTEEIGAAVSDDTVRRALAKIPDALKSREK